MRQPFIYDYDDKQEQDLAVAFVGNISGLTNVPKSEISGAELDMQWIPAEGWGVHLGVAILDTEITEWMAVDGAASSWPTVVTRDVSGQELAQSPDLQYSALVNYEWVALIPSSTGAKSNTTLQLQPIREEVLTRLSSSNYSSRSFARKRQLMHGEPADRVLVWLSHAARSKRMADRFRQAMSPVVDCA